MQLFRIFRFLFRRRTWIELDPVSGQETPIDREDVIDDLDIRDDSEEGTAIANANFAHLA